MASPRKTAALLLALAAFATPSVLASTYCGTSIGGCAGGATVSGDVEVSGPSCVWTCVAPDNSTTRCTSGTLSDPCIGLNIPEKVEANTGFVRDGEDTFDAWRPHSPDIAHTMAGDSIRLCSHRVDSQDDIDALAPYATRFSWGWPTSPTYAALQPDLGDACYQYTPGTSHRPLFTRTEAEFHSFLEWALARDNAAAAGAALEVDSMCLYLYESDTTRRARYVAASPAGEHTNLLGDNWIDANAAGDCPCDQEAYECREACPTLATGAVIDGLLCGLPSCFANLASHWGPATSTVCSGVSFTQTNACDNSTRPATGTDTGAGCLLPDTGCSGTWGPDPATVCAGVTFTQTCSSDSSLTRPATGSQVGCPPVVPTCTGTWDPVPATVCAGVAFTQTCSSDSSLTRTAAGTSATVCTCTERTITSTWVATQAATLCEDGLLERIESCSPGTAGTGSCQTGCAGYPWTAESHTIAATNPSDPSCGACTSHSLSMTTTTVPATCMESGLESTTTSCTPGTGTCATAPCPAGYPSIVDVVLPMLTGSPYTLDTSTELVEATCTAAGYERITTTCTPGTGACGQACPAGYPSTVDVVLPMLPETPYTLDTSTELVEATCTAAGYERTTTTCTPGPGACGQACPAGYPATTETVLPQLPADWAPDCDTADVGTTYTQTNSCGDTRTANGCREIDPPCQDCQDRTVIYGAWTPPAALCTSVTQTRSVSCTPGQNAVAGSGTCDEGCTVSCAGLGTSETQTAAATTPEHESCGGWCCGSLMVGCTCWEVSSAGTCYGNLGFAGSTPMPGCEVE